MKLESSAAIDEGRACKFEKNFSVTSHPSARLKGSREKAFKRA